MVALAFNFIAVTGSKSGYVLGILRINLSNIEDDVELKGGVCNPPRTKK